MEYRLSLTPRLVAVGFFAVVALLVLLFALGFQLGQRLAAGEAPGVSRGHGVARGHVAAAAATPAAVAVAPAAATAPAGEAP